MGQAEPPEPSRYPPADLRLRVLARVADVLLAFAPLWVAPNSRLAAGLFAVGLLLCNDRLFGPGRSLGKRLFGLRVVVLKSRKACGITASMRRNLTLAAALVPVLIGAPHPLLFSGALLLAAGALEALVLLLPLTRDLGRRRLGDLWAGTQVIDASIALGLPAAESLPPAPTATALVSSRQAARNAPPPQRPA